MEKIKVYVFPFSRVILFFLISLTYQTNAGEHMCFAITEPFILQIFQDFLTDMDSDVYYTPDEAVAIIDRMIRQLEAK